MIDCIYDEQVQGRDGRFEVVISPRGRPANATSECGVGWLRWGGQPEGFPLLRHMLPSVGLRPGESERPVAGTETDVIGEYLPVGDHTTK